MKFRIHLLGGFIFLLLSCSCIAEMDDLRATKKGGERSAKQQRWMAVGMETLAIVGSGTWFRSDLPALAVVCFTSSQ